MKKIQQADINKLVIIRDEAVCACEMRDAAARFAQAVAGTGLCWAHAGGGKVEIRAAITGLLKVNPDALEQINELGQVAAATLHSNQMVAAGRKVAGCKVVPLAFDADHISQIEQICAEHYPVLAVKALRSYKVGVVTTGDEVYYGRIKDRFGPVLTEKFRHLGSSLLQQIIVPDDIAKIVEAIHQLLSAGADMIITTGGMSVNPDDLTPAGIWAAGGNIISYGAPIMPEAMFMLAYFGKVPVLGLPGGVMHQKRTAFDLLVPRLLAGEELSRTDINKLGYGGLCIACEECRHPQCGFGKGECPNGLIAKAW